MLPLTGRGRPACTRARVRHRRGGAVPDEFSHRLFMAYVDLDELPMLFAGSRLWSARGPALAWFRRSDYLGDERVPLKQAVRELVARRSGVSVDGPVRVLTHLRYFGHCFNPVSFYYCFEADGERVMAVVAEVTNTPWGERHAYVMPVADAHDDDGTAKVMRTQLAKQLHVSPLLEYGSALRLAPDRAIGAAFGAHRGQQRHGRPARV